MSLRHLRDIVARPMLAWQAEQALREGEVAVGCVLVDSRNGAVIGRGRNATVATKNGTRHAEFVAVDEVLGAGHEPSVFGHVDL
jgi:tRNA(Arg) A34 adenosine deaminase TadA